MYVKVEFVGSAPLRLKEMGRHQRGLYLGREAPGEDPTGEPRVEVEPLEDPQPV